jgi:thioredoxin reductase (NADPH)
LADYEIAVVGGGPAGLTAALFAARRGRSTVLVDPLGSGGALLNLERIEDFPGFPEGISGFELGPRLQQQLTDAGGAVELGEVVRLEQRAEEWVVTTDSREIVARAVIVATGSRSRELGIPGEEQFKGRGLSDCASCDGPLYNGKLVAVYGGGDEALAETLDLVGHDVRVVLVHPGEALDGQETYVRRVADSGQVEVRPGAVLEEIVGDGQVEGVRVRDLASGESTVLAVEGVFAYAGRVPNAELLAGMLELGEDGRVPTDAWMRTALPGLFAAGDVRTGAAGHAVTSAGDGATAAIAAHRYLAGDTA